MATVSFNEAVDQFGAEQDDLARQWAGKSISLAHYCDDGGRLEALLQERYLMLGLEK
jgi:hypothetical protein